MNTADIIRQLENSGIHVLPGSDASRIFIEDPACILRGFQTFIEYAWIIIATVTGVMLFGWAIALLRGSKNTVPTNVRNLLLMFGTLAAVIPIVNLVYGDDVFARGCRRIEVDMAAVKEIMEERNRHLRGSDALYEVFDISDTGPREVPAEDTAPRIEYISMKYDSKEELFGPGSGVGRGNSSGTKRSSDAGSVVSGTNEHTAVSATDDGSDVIYTYGDGTRTRYTSGTRAWRNTNPGNIVVSDFAKRAGAIGSGGRFAVFPSEEVGMAAIVSLLQSATYRDLTIAGAIARYAPPKENDTERYNRDIAEITGLDISRTVSSLTSAELQSVANAIRQKEGWRTGQKIDLKD